MTRLLLLVLLLPLASCAQTDLVDEFKLAAGESRSSFVEGSAPYVIVANDGPGLLDVRVDGRSGLIDHRRIRAGTKGGFTTFGPATITCTAPDDAAAQVSIRFRETRQAELEAAQRSRQ